MIKLLPNEEWVTPVNSDVGMCQSCKFWTKLPNPQRMGHCKNKHWVYDSNSCAFEEDMLVSCPLKPSVVADMIYTGPKFGCIHWEQK